MKHFFIAGIFVLLLFNAKAQGFSKLYFDNRPSMLFSSIEVTDSSYYVTGVSTNKTPPLRKRAFVGKLTVNGGIDTIKYQWDTLPYQYEIFGNSLKRIGNEYLATGALTDSVPRAFIVKFDTLMNLTFWCQYTDSPCTIFQGFDVVQTKDKGYLLAVNKSLNGDNNVFIIKTDSIGEVLNKKLYQGGDKEYPWVIKPMLNGNYMIGAFRMKSNTFTPFWCKTWLIEVDSMGNMVNQWQDTSDRNLHPKAMEQTADSGWIMVRQYLSIDVSDFQQYKAGIVKYSKNFEKQWEHLLGDSSTETAFNDIEVLLNGDYIVCGTKAIWGSGLAQRFGWLAKFSANGAVLWDKKYVAYEAYGTHNFLNDIEVLPNGDLVACGELKFTVNIGVSPIQQGWILRTDSNGCVIDNCLVSINEQDIDESNFVRVYPNPANEFAVFESNGVQDLKLEVYDLLGKQVMASDIPGGARTVVDAHTWPTGVYTWQAIDGERKRTGQGKLSIMK